MSKYSRKIVALLAFLLVLPLVFAVPPFSSIEEGMFEGGVVVKYPIIELIKTGQTMEFDFHLFNKSNGYPITSGFSCNLHLYNSSDGKHLYEGFKDTVTHTFDYEIEIDGGNFSVGEYFYTIQCNNSEVGGEDTIPFEVTNSGILTDETQSNLIIAFMIILFGASFVFAFLMYAFKPGEDGSNVGLHMSLMRMLLFFMSLYLLLSGIGLMVSISQDQVLGTAYAHHGIASLEVITTFIWVAAIITLLFFIFDLFMTFNKLGEGE